MRPVIATAAFFLIAATACAPAPSASVPTLTPRPVQATASTARVVAVGIPGATGVSPVGVFHAGGPFHDKAEFAAFTQPGKMLDAERILVTSTSNFGAPKARSDQGEGSALSLDPRGDTLMVPTGFASGGNQASALDGRVQLYTAQSAAFVNRLTAPMAASANEAGVSGARDISINNAFGRVWFANVPTSLDAEGTETIIDPDGRPLANAPSPQIGGVFVGGMTNRAQQVISGSLSTGAVANALLGRSPDGSTRAVFAVVMADGGVVQAHTEKGLDGLAPPNTIHPLTGSNATRTGAVFNWTPDRIQSERFYMALKGHGATVRYVTLPYEAHGYAARETHLHVIAEKIAWFDKYVKNAPPRTTE